jgi:hypothetical protein
MDFEKEMRSRRVIECWKRIKIKHYEIITLFLPAFICNSYHSEILLFGLQCSMKLELAI